jgi:diaminopimelate decarboxylase
MGEFRICRDLAIPAEKLYISGVLKIREDLMEILAYGQDAARYTAESPLQLQMLSDWADAHGKTLRVYPRLTNKSQFGMDEDTICDLIANREKYPHIEFAGIHFFSGTQKKKLKKHEKELQMLDAFFARLAEEAGFTVPELEYGTGFAVSYFEDQKKDEDLRDPDNLALFGQMVRDMQWKGIVTIEMGRAYAAECGCYVTTALDIKHNNGNAVCLVDGGIHQINYDGQIKGMYRPQMSVISVDEAADREEAEWGIYGSLCTMNDVLCRSFPAAIALGDRIVFHKTGAYSVYEGMSLFLSHELPAVVLYGDKEGFIPARTQMQTYTLNMAKY